MKVITAALKIYGGIVVTGWVLTMVVCTVGLLVSNASFWTTIMLWLIKGVALALLGALALIVLVAIGGALILMWESIINSIWKTDEQKAQEKKYAAARGDWETTFARALESR